MTQKRKNPAALPVILLTAATVAAVGVGTAVFVMPQAKPRRRKKSMPTLVGGLRDSGIEFRHEEDSERVQADFLLVTSPSKSEWASKAAEWMHAKITQPVIEIYFWPGSEELRTALVEAWDARVVAGAKKEPAILSFIDAEGVDEQRSENPAWPWLAGGAVALGLSQVMCIAAEKYEGRPIRGRLVMEEMYRDHGVEVHRSRRICDPWKNFHVTVYEPHPSVGYEDGHPIPMEIPSKAKSFPTLSSAMVYFNEQASQGRSKWGSSI